MSRKGVLQVMLGEAELALIAELAQREGLSASAVARRILMNVLEPEVHARSADPHLFNNQVVQPLPEWSLSTVVHILQHGRTLCRSKTVEGVPRDWPRGHRWVSFQEPFSVLGSCPPDRRCEACWRANDTFLGRTERERLARERT